MRIKCTILIVLLIQLYLISVGIMEEHGKFSIIKVIQTNKNSGGRSYFFHLILYALFFLLALYLTVIRNSDYLFKLQDLSLFLPTKLFLINTLAVPAGFLTYIGLFFTQFFYYPWLGGMIFIALLLAVQLLTSKVFHLQSKYFPLSFIPSLLLLLAFTQLGYYIFTMYSKGYSFSHLFGILFTLGIFWAYQSIKHPNYRLLFSILFVPVFFHLLGFYSLFTAILFVLFEAISIKKSSQSIQLTTIGFSLLLIFAVPFLFNRFIYVVTMFPNIYINGLPSFSITQDNSLYLPFIFLFLFLIAITLNFISVKSSQKSNRITLYISVLIFVITSFFTFHYSYNDENFRTELAMNRAISDSNWNEVLELADNLKSEPTRLIVMSTNLALRKLHMAGEKMFTYKNGNKEFNVKRPILLIEIAGTIFYYHYGQINYCYKWCMEDMMHNGMKIENLKYFVKSCLLNKEYALAGKYNDVLLKTTFHKSWAKKYQKYIDNPETISSNPEFKEIAQLQIPENNLFSEDINKFEEFLRYSFATTTVGPPEMMEISIQSILEYKNDKAFWPVFMNYLKTHPKIPVHYQEAALLFYSFERDIDMSQINLNQNIIDRFREFVKMKKMYNQYSADKQKDVFARKFGKTYWYYYFFN